MFFNLSFLFSSSLEDYFYEVADIFTYLDNTKLEDNEYQEVLGNISKVFKNIYAFFNISKNPPNHDYHSKVEFNKDYPK